MIYDIDLIDKNGKKHKYDSNLLKRLSKTFKNHIESEAWEESIFYAMNIYLIPFLSHKHLLYLFSFSYPHSYIYDFIV